MTELDMCLRLAIAAAAGAAIGIEREALRKPAGMRTHLIVCTAAALLTATSILVGEQLQVPGEALRVAAGVVTGIGFIGAGTILQSRGGVIGLTTAATVFMAAAIGIAIGTGLYLLAASATALTILPTWLLLPAEKLIHRKSPEVPAGEPAKKTRKLRGGDVPD
jgi:putative Mg2+ transporter-C (MgtC) family protein